MSLLLALLIVLLLFYFLVGKILMENYNSPVLFIRPCMGYRHTIVYHKVLFGLIFSLIITN